MTVMTAWVGKVSSPNSLQNHILQHPMTRMTLMTLPFKFRIEVLAIGKMATPVDPRPKKIKLEGMCHLRHTRHSPLKTRRPARHQVSFYDRFLSWPLPWKTAYANFHNNCALDKPSLSSALRSSRILARNRMRRRPELPRAAKPTDGELPMKISDLTPYARQLIKLGIRRPRKSVRDLFGPPQLQRTKREPPIKPDVDYPNHDERTPQGQAYTQMWLDHWDNYGNTKNPIGSPME
jgi:hypothetical protein